MSIAQRIGTGMLLLILGFSSSGCAKPLNAQLRYVAPHGQGDGRSAEAPMSLEAANQQLRPGQTALLLDGRYTQLLRPERSGKKGAYITYRAAPGAQPQLVGRPDRTHIVNLDGLEYVRIQGLNIRFDPMPTAQQRGIVNRAVVSNILIGNGRHHDIVDNRIINPQHSPEQIDTDHRRYNVREMGVTLHARAEHNLVRGNTLVGMLSQGVYLSGRYNRIQRNHIIRTHGNAVMLKAKRDLFEVNLIEENVLSGSVLSDGVQSNPDFSVEDLSQDVSANGLIIRRNLITHNGENGIDLKGASHMLVEDNLIVQNYGSHDGPLRKNRTGGFGGVGHGARSSTDRIIVRRNIIYDNASGVFLANGWLVYNNVLINNSRDYASANSEHLLPSAGQRKPRFVGAGGWARQVAFLNNIVGDHPEVEMLYNAGYGDLAMDGNLYFNHRREPRFVVAYRSKSDWQAGSFQAWQADIGQRNDNAALERHSQVGAPKFQRVPPRPTGVQALDFRLRSGSPAIDSAVPLTHCVADSRGAVLRVADARFFFDGFGWLVGDEIQLQGQPQRAQVLKVDLEQNQLQLDKALSCQLGQGVNVAYRGAAADRGACERGEVFCPSDLYGWLADWQTLLQSNGVDQP